MSPERSPGGQTRCTPRPRSLAGRGGRLKGVGGPVAPQPQGMDYDNSGDDHSELTGDHRCGAGLERRWRGRLRRPRAPVPPRRRRRARPRPFPRPLRLRLRNLSEGAAGRGRVFRRARQVCHPCSWGPWRSNARPRLSPTHDRRPFPHRRRLRLLRGQAGGDAWGRRHTQCQRYL